MMSITGRVAHIETIYRIYDPSGTAVTVRPDDGGTLIEIETETYRIYLSPIIARGVAEVIVKCADSLEAR